MDGDARRQAMAIYLCYTAVASSEVVTSYGVDVLQAVRDSGAYRHGVKHWARLADAARIRHDTYVSGIMGRVSTQEYYADVFTHYDEEIRPYIDKLEYASRLWMQRAGIECHKLAAKVFTLRTLCDLHGKNIAERIEAFKRDGTRHFAGKTFDAERALGNFALTGYRSCVRHLWEDFCDANIGKGGLPDVNECAMIASGVDAIGYKLADCTLLEDIIRRTNIEDGEDCPDE